MYHALLYSQKMDHCPLIPTAWEFYFFVSDCKFGETSDWQHRLGLFSYGDIKHIGPKSDHFLLNMTGHAWDFEMVILSICCAIICDT